MMAEDTAAEGPQVLDILVGVDRLPTGSLGSAAALGESKVHMQHQQVAASALDLIVPDDSD
jgi:hypothetical protein